jgi:PPIC-type PPIASE domain
MSPPITATGSSVVTTSLETPTPSPDTSIPLAIVPGGTPDLGTRVLAIVGNQTILANDLLTGIDDKISKAAREAPPDMVNAELDNMFQKMLPKAIDYKLLYIEFLRMVPPEGIPAMEDQAGKHFAETEVPKYFAEFKVNSLAELDAKLRDMGTTLIRVKRTHFEMEVAKQILPRLMKFDPEVSHDDRIEYYRKHIDEYLEPAQVRWERLTVNFDRCDSRDAAFKEIARMGNEVLGGAPFAEVAKRSSHCPRAAQGGMYDWTRFDSLASVPIEGALKTIEPGKLSRIITDDNGVHIVRVIERRQASYRAFEVAQDGILEKIREERFQAKMQSTLDRLRKETEIWTVYDPDPKSSPKSPAPHAWIQPSLAVQN